MQGSEAASFGQEHDGSGLRRTPWPLAPLKTLPRSLRGWLLAFCPLLVLLWCVYRNRHPEFAWVLPDVRFYLDMAHGQYGRVPQPFTSRPLAPLLAGGLARVFRSTIESGFTALAFVSLTWTLCVVFWLLLRSAAPRWTLFAVACLPFWEQMLGYAGLPDPLYTALLATLLLALEYDRILLAAGLMLPLMMAREATSLTLFCLLLVGWRRLRWSGGLLALGCAAAGALAVRRFSASGLPNPEHLTGGLYMVGKIVSNSARSLGIVPWSNVYPYLCKTPAWQTALSLGGVRRVGVCSWDAVAPMQASWAFLTTFGALPVLLLNACTSSGRSLVARSSLLVRFCVLYGGISLLLAPTLGTWYARLVAYAWPLLLVAVPRLLTGPAAGLHTGSLEGDPRNAGLVVGAALLALHLWLCALGDQIATGPRLSLVLLLQGTCIALFLVQLNTRRSPPARV